MLKEHDENSFSIQKMTESEFKRKIFEIHFKADKKSLTLEKFNDIFIKEVLQKDSENYSSEMLAMYANDLMKIRA